MTVLETLIDRAVKVCGSQAHLANRLGTSRQLVHGWSKGISVPSEVHVGQMALIVGVRVEDALLARDECILKKDPHGAEVLRALRGGFLRGGAATFSISATLLCGAASQILFDFLHIVSIKGAVFMPPWLSLRHMPCGHPEPWSVGGLPFVYQEGERVMVGA